MASDEHITINGDDAVAILDAAADLLSRVSLNMMDHDGIDPVGRAIARTRGRLDLVQSAYVCRIRDMSDAGESAPPEDELGRRQRMSGADAARATRHAALLEKFSSTRRALADGLISSGHVDALANLWAQLDASDQAMLLADDASLANQAAHQSVEDFRRRLWQRKDRNETRNGMTEAEKQKRRNKMTGGIEPASARYQYYLDLERELGARFETAIAVEVDRMRRTGELEELHPDLVSHESHLRAYALMRLITRGHRFVDPPVDGDDPRPSGLVELGVLMDARTLMEGEHDGSICELVDGYPFPIAAARRLACEAGIYPIVLSGAGEVLDLGRAQRLANRAQRRALRGMYRTCGASNCEVPFVRCQVHHTDAWEDGGPTDIGLLVPLCGRHHHLVHDMGWHACLDADRTLHMRRPDGTWDSSQPLRPLLEVAPTRAETGSPPGGGGRQAWPDAEASGGGSNDNRTDEPPGDGLHERPPGQHSPPSEQLVLVA